MFKTELKKSKQYTDKISVFPCCQYKESLKCSLVNEWKRTFVVNRHTMNYFSNLEKKEILSFLSKE